MLSVQVSAWFFRKQFFKLTYKAISEFSVLIIRFHIFSKFIDVVYDFISNTNQIVFNVDKELTGFDENDYLLINYKVSNKEFNEMISFKM